MTIDRRKFLLGSGLGAVGALTALSGSGEADAESVGAGPGPDATLGDALERMERRRSQISVLPVVDQAGRALGLLRLHDIYLGQRLETADS